MIIYIHRHIYTYEIYIWLNIYYIYTFIHMYIHSITHQYIYIIQAYPEPYITRKMSN